MRTALHDAQSQRLNGVGASGNCWGDSASWWLRRVAGLWPSSPNLHLENEQVAARARMPAARSCSGSNHNRHGNGAQVHNPCLLLPVGRFGTNKFIGRNKNQQSPNASLLPSRSAQEGLKTVTLEKGMCLPPVVKSLI